MDLPTIAETAQRFRDGSLTPVALVEEVLARIEREQPRLNAFTHVSAAGARAAAAEAERELREGRNRGPLHGVPVAVKDLFDIAGTTLTAGAHPDFHLTSKSDAAVVEKLREAGAVIVGKTALHEWALGVTNRNPHSGPTRNPRDPSRIPGGSSGGSAAAVAADLCLAAIGTDTGGSIRIPAALCGVVGLKPTRDLVSKQGVFPLAPSLDHVGSLAKTVEDVFLLLEAVSEFRRAEPSRPKVLIPAKYFGEELDAGVERLVRAAAERLGPARTVDLGDVQEVWNANSAILLSEAASVHEDRLRDHSGKFGEDVRCRLEAGRDLPAADYARALGVQKRWTASLAELLGDRSILAVPTVPIVAPTIEESEGMLMSKVLTRFTAPFNLCGFPALSIPCGEVDGLPVGLQLVAGPHRESLLFAAGRIVEEG